MCVLRATVKKNEDYIAINTIDNIFSVFIRDDTFEKLDIKPLQVGLI